MAFRDASHEIQFGNFCLRSIKQKFDRKISPKNFRKKSSFLHTKNLNDKLKKISQMTTEINTIGFTTNFELAFEQKNFLTYHEIEILL